MDDTAAGALRVIDHFDSLVEERASVAAVVRATAALAGCPAGAHDAARGFTRRYDAAGRSLPDVEKDSWAHAAVPGRPGSSVWLERGGGVRPLDALLLERSARAIQALAEAAPHSSDAMVRIACDPDASEADRRDAVTRLGLTGPVTVVVSALPGLPSSHATLIGRHSVSLLAGTPELPPALRAGTAMASGPEQLPAAMERARLALRLTDRLDGPGVSLVAYDDLGALAVFVERVTPQEAAAVPDVRRLDDLLTTRPWAIDTIQAVIDQASLRQAANGLHVHHSTLQERLTWLAHRLGYVITKPGGRQRAVASVTLWRIAHCEDEAAAGDG
ncbi:hypothetical protein ABZ357_28730 [Streptomyces sp. NPDC005917]|uniref:hypothetical protein n=1 Tax=unclassified Streptomyces TaxID=2593676 RepID=UPI0033EE0B6B